MIKQEELLARQLQMQAEADAIVDEMHLKQLLTESGTPVKVGSAALGLMAWRDLDITVVCSKLNILQFFTIDIQSSSPRFEIHQ